MAALSEPQPGSVIAIADQTGFSPLKRDMKRSSAPACRPP
jgi:hypothetical protein